MFNLSCLGLYLTVFSGFGATQGEVQFLCWLLATEYAVSIIPAIPALIDMIVSTEVTLVECLRDHYSKNCTDTSTQQKIVFHFQQPVLHMSPLAAEGFLEQHNLLQEKKKRTGLAHPHSRIETMAPNPVSLCSGSKSSESFSFARRQPKISN